MSGPPERGIFLIHTVVSHKQVRANEASITGAALAASPSAYHYHLQDGFARL